MQIRKTLIALLALAIAIAFSPCAGLQAASPLGPGSQPGTENLTYTVKAKKAPRKKGKAKAKERPRRQRARARAPAAAASDVLGQEAQLRDASSKK